MTFEEPNTVTGELGLRDMVVNYVETNTTWPDSNEAMKAGTLYIPKKGEGDR